MNVTNTYCQNSRCAHNVRHSTRRLTHITSSAATACCSLCPLGSNAVRSDGICNGDDGADGEDDVSVAVVVVTVVFTVVAILVIFDDVVESSVWLDGDGMLFIVVGKVDDESPQKASSLS